MGLHRPSSPRAPWLIARSRWHKNELQLLSHNFRLMENA
jgi:hypothetical protein